MILGGLSSGSASFKLKMLELIPGVSTVKIVNGGKAILNTIRSKDSSSASSNLKGIRSKSILALEMKKLEENCFTNITYHLLCNLRQAKHHRIGPHFIR